MKRAILIAALLTCTALFGAAQHMFDYSHIQSGQFTQKTVQGLRSMNDGEHYTVREGNRIVKYSYKTGLPTATLFDMADHSQMAQDSSGLTNYQLSSNEDKILLTTNEQQIYRRSFTANYWIYDIKKGELYMVGPETSQVGQLSSDGNSFAYVDGNDIWYLELDSQGGISRKRLTSDGKKNAVINGHTDWVYEEEFGFTRAFEISPDGKKIAYISFDETGVKDYTFMKFTGEQYPLPYTYKYPSAGEQNSKVTLKVIDIQTGNEVTVEPIINSGTDEHGDFYIPRIGWTPEGQLYFYKLNRTQNHFQVILCEGVSYSPQVIYEEKDSRYVEHVTEETITFLPKGRRFIVKSERSGYRHLYLHNIEKGVTDTITQGNWEVTQLVGVTNDRVYYISNEGSALRNNLYSVKLNGKGKTRLTAEDGIYSIVPSKNFKYFISYFSNISTPMQVRLHDQNGKVVRVLENNEELVRRIGQYKLPKKEFFRFTTERGTVLNGYMIKPAEFDPSKKYPVMMTQYSGPGSQQVRDRWSIDWTDVLVQEGYIVVCVDGRGTGGRGADFRKVTYRNLGGPETEDQISAAKYIATQPFVDMERIGIYGWSFGGFMSLNCILKGGNVFKMAISVAPVTSWRFYDTIYTEIFNGTPSDNPSGYDNNAPINYAEQLKGKLLIIHGTADDNVHVQNTYAMATALTSAGKQFDMMIYPDDNHSMHPKGRHHVMQKMIDYTLQNL